MRQSKSGWDETNGKCYIGQKQKQLGIEIYRFEVSNYHIGEIVTFCGLLFDITREPLVRFCSNKFKKIPLICSYNVCLYNQQFCR